MQNFFVADFKMNLSVKNTAHLKEPLKNRKLHTKLGFSDKETVEIQYKGYTAQFFTTLIAAEKRT